MKRIITSLLLFLVVMCSYAQTKRYYCEVKGIEKELSSGLKIIFDFGNQVSHWDRYLGMMTAMTQVPVPTTTHSRWRYGRT